MTLALLPERYQRSPTLMRLLILAGCTILFLLAPPLRGAEAAEHTWSFDCDIHGDPEAPKPLSSGGGVSIEDAEGAAGRAVRFDPASRRRGAALFISGENLPHQGGEIWIRIRPHPGGRWDDGARRWLLAVVPVVGEIGFPTDQTGIGIGLVKAESGALEVVVHRFHDERLTADYRERGKLIGMTEPDLSLFSKSLPETPASSWVSIGLRWDPLRGSVSLLSEDSNLEAKVPWLPTKLRVLIVGAPPAIDNVEREGFFDGLLDELVIRTERAGRQNLPGSHSNDSSLGSRASSCEERRRTPQTVDGVTDPERAVRRHFSKVLATRKPGGWAPIVTVPGGLHFFSRDVMVPYSPRHYLGMTRASSVITALRLLAAYRVLHDARFLAAANSLAELVLSLQQLHGGWPSLALLGDGGATTLRNPRQLTFKDRTQTMPIVLLTILADMIGDARYARAVDRGYSLLARSQNSSGSWPNHIRLPSFARASVSGAFGAGELNDFATTDPMNLMLFRYRRDADLDSLARYLMAADWIAGVFIDGEAKGWARQYDADGQPIPARHHEPPAIALQDMEDVPLALADAWIVTGNQDYRAVLERWIAWMERSESSRGWHPYYDPASGRPLLMRNKKILPSDESNASPFGMRRAIREVKRTLEQAGPRPHGSEAHRLARLRRLSDRALGDFDADAGSWITDNGPQGPAFSPATQRVCALLAFIDASEPASHEDWKKGVDDNPCDPFEMLMPREALLAPIDAKTIASARKQIPRLQAAADQQGEKSFE